MSEIAKIEKVIPIELGVEESAKPVTSLLRYTLELLLGALVITSLVASLPVQALSLVTVKVTVQSSTCNINDNQPIKVEFDDVMTTLVDGIHYEKPVDYTVACEGISNNSMKLQISGTGAGFDGDFLQSSVPDLGVAIKRDGAPLPLNKWTSFTYPEKPSLTVVPVKKAGAILPAGDFNATAVMYIDYQ
ncbi:fimbrial protein [Enterobacter roggenkampii]|uniref:fimbrial protein n=1 Tax=Enterobacter roggenkampii TaxID=1812935 RepID=UPI000DA17CC0|nr:fimbrial protein [Enterobacter roggenkampii]